MNRTIFKYPLSVTNVAEVSMPKGAKILSLQTQREMPCVWALVDPEAELTTRRFAVFGTGHGVPENPGQFIGTFQLRGGSLVFHVFENGVW